MRDRDLIPDLPVLVSKTFPPGHIFPYSNDDRFLDSGVWYWSVLRFKKRNLDWYWDTTSFYIAKQKLEKVFEILGKWIKYVDYVQWFIDQEGYVETARWEFNYLTSAHSLNKYLGNETIPEDTQWWKDYLEELSRRDNQLAKEVELRKQELAISKREFWRENSLELAAKTGTDPDAVKKPFADTP